LADVSWGRTGANNIAGTFSALSLSLADAACVDTVIGSYVGPCDGLEILGVLFQYDETGGGMTAATVSLRVKAAGQALVAQPHSCGATPGAWGASVTATGNYFFPTTLPGVTSAGAGGAAGPLAGIDEVAVAVAVTGTGTTGNILKAWLVSRRIAA
jgi:hypothetical protein